MLNRVERTKYARATVVYTQEYPITLLIVGLGQMSRLNARCLPIPYHKLGLPAACYFITTISKEYNRSVLRITTGHLFSLNKRSLSESSFLPNTYITMTRVLLCTNVPPASNAFLSLIPQQSSLCELIYTTIRAYKHIAIYFDHQTQ